MYKILKIKKSEYKTKISIKSERFYFIIIFSKLEYFEKSDLTKIY